MPASRVLSYLILLYLILCWFQMWMSASQSCLVLSYLIVSCLIFHRLIDRNVPVILVRFFMAWYCTQEFVVRWGKCCSTTFTTSNGVRQGGILSPLFFNVYMDKLSCTLNDTKAGYIMNGVYMNHLMYADDLVLIAPSVRAL